MKISLGNMKTKIMAYVMKVIQTILVNMMKTNIILEKGQYVLRKVILWKQILHRRNETRVCKFSGPD